MNWPLPQDFNEAVQNPASAFNDPDLKAGQAVVGPTGLPLPRSGNFADVYQIRAADGRSWAVKCFTRPVTGLEQRYAKVDAALDKAGLPFTIGFTFLNEGVRVRGKWLPAVKMEWVDGLLLNQVVRDQAGNPKVLDALCQMWARLCKRLRETGIAHADFQHGNVLLVPGSKPGSYGLKLIDYDGMYVPALANSPSGEAGHPNFQHPARAAKQVYSPDLDRFPHLVIATALKGLSVVGPSLWERYDSGDNLLFSEDDFRTPAASKLMRELWETKNPGLQTLVGHLAIACGKPVPQTPWLDQVAPDGIAVPLSPEQSRAAAAALDLAPPPTVVPAVTMVAPPAVVAEVMVAPPAPAGADAFAGFDVEPDPEPAARRKKPRPEPKAKKTSPVLPIAIAAGVLVLLGGVVGAVVLLGGKKADETVQKEPDDQNKDDPGRLKPPVIPVSPKPPVTVPKPPDREPIIPPQPVSAGGEVPPLNLAPSGVPVLSQRWARPIAGRPRAARGSRDGKWIFVHNFNSPDIRVHTADSGTPAATFTDPVGPVADFAPLDDGSAASWAAGEPFALVWNPATGKPTGKLPIGTPPADAGAQLFAASDDGRYVIVGHGGPALPTDPKAVGEIKVFDTRPARLVFATEVRSPAFRFTPDGRLLIAEPARSRWVRLSDGATEADVGSAPRPGGRCLSTSADGRRVLSAPVPYELKVVDSRTGKTLAQFPSNYSSLAGALSEDGRYAAVCSFPARGDADQQTTYLNLIDLSAGRLVARVEMSRNRSLDVVHLAFTPDGKGLIACHSAGQKVEVFDLPGGLVAGVPQTNNPDPTRPNDPLPPPAAGEAKPVWTAPATARAGWGYATFTSGGEAVVVGSTARGGLKAFSARIGTPLRPVGDRDAIYGVMRLGRGRVGVYSPNDKSVFVWDPRLGAQPGVPAPDLRRRGNIPVIRMSPDERWLAFGYHPTFRPNDPGDPKKGGKLIPGEFEVYDLTTGKPVVTTEWSNNSAYFTADSTRLLVFERTGRARWFKLPSGQPDGEWQYRDEKPGVLAQNAVGMSGDGQFLLVEEQVTRPPREKGMYLVDARTGRTVRRVSDATVTPNGAAALTPDARVAAALIPGKTGDGAAIEVIDVARGAPVTRLKLPTEPSTKFSGFDLSPDGRSVVVYDIGAGRVAVYDLPDGLQAGGPKPKTPNPVVVNPTPKDPDPVIVPKPKDPTPKPADRKPVPDDAAVAKAGMKLREDLKSDYAKRLPAEKRAFAQKLLGLAEVTADDPATRYVMLRDARDVAIEVSDPPLAMQAVDGLLRWYDLDTDQVKLPALEQLKYKVGNTTALRAVVDLALVAGDTAAAADRHETAVKYAQLAVTAARRANIPAVIEETDGELTRAKKAAEAFAPVKAALDQLRTNPGDREAALLAGKYRCFTQGRWDEGVKLLAGGGAGGLKAAAELDAATPRTGVPDVKAADAWWEFARSAPEPEKGAAESRARYWYARALPGLPADRRPDVEKRLALSVNGMEYRPGLFAEFTAKVPTVLRGKKARIDPGVAFTGGEFKAEGIGKATDVTVKWSGVISAPRPGRYKLVVAATDPVRVRLDGKAVIDMTAAKAGRRETIVVLPDRPTPIAVEFTCLNTDKHNLKLCWVAPGGEAEELVPPEALFHDRKAEGALGKAP